MAVEEKVSPEQSPLTGKLLNELELLERHVVMLKAIREEEPIGIIRLSIKTGLPQHKVRYSLRILESEGLIEPSTDGALSTPKVKEFFTEFSATLDKMVFTIERIKKMLGPASPGNAQQQPPQPPVSGPQAGNETTSPPK